MGINLRQIEKTIGYEFQNEDLLQQAFITRGYSTENGGQNNQVLEFIGDKALDLAVIRLMMERFGVITSDKDWNEFKLRNPKYFKTKLNEGQFTDIKKDLVKKGALAQAMENLGLKSQLIMGKGECKQNRQDDDSVKEDLFEAIIGAVTLDCEWNMDIITDVVTTMIDFDNYFDNYEDDNYVALLQQWLQKNDYDLPCYSYDEGYDNFTCEVNIDEIGCFTGEGESKAKARMNCAQNAYNYLEDEGYILNIYEEAVGEPDEENALRQINELAQKGLISKPKYNFNQTYDEYGNCVWECECVIDENDNTFTNTASSKKQAQKMSTFDMLLDLMDEYDDYYEEDDD